VTPPQPQLTNRMQLQMTADGNKFSARVRGKGKKSLLPFWRNRAPEVRWEGSSVGKTALQLSLAGSQNNAVLGEWGGSLEVAGEGLGDLPSGGTGKQTSEKSSSIQDEVCHLPCLPLPPNKPCFPGELPVLGTGSHDTRLQLYRHPSPPTTTPLHTYSALVGY